MKELFQNALRGYIHIYYDEKYGGVYLDPLIISLNLVLMY